MVEGHQLLDATIVALWAILLSSAGVTQMHYMPEPEIRVLATKAVTIRTMVVVMDMFMVRPEVGTIMDICEL